MKGFLFILTVVVASTRVSNALTEEQKTECFTQFHMDPSNFKEVPKSSDPKAELLKYTTEDKFVCIIACMFRKDMKDNETIYDILNETVKKDYQYHSKQEELLTILESCKHIVDDCEFLQCIKLSRSPFCDTLFG